ncbi:cobalamin biosynthesis protein [Novispirillum itersonii]|uniref:cobalamin biosynthesis protein n=1 Tax=Novispirillum itersonii TaxID=189 RepID=UPI0009DBD9C3|nr:cobalamin biosynthesis protein [Novispirillum itersonii]
MQHPRSQIHPVLFFAGAGCTSTARTKDLLALLNATLPPGGSLASLASLDRRCSLPALTETAAIAGCPLVPVSATALTAETTAAPSAAAIHSGVASVAEAAALASARQAAGPGQKPVLWLAKQTGPGCTVALAILTVSG